MMSEDSFAVNDANMTGNFICRPIGVALNAYVTCRDMTAFYKKGVRCL